MLKRTIVTGITLLLGSLTISASAAAVAEADLEPRFKDTVQPFVKTYCAGCHGGEKPMAQFDLAHYNSTAEVVEGYKHWALVLQKLDSKQMPPQASTQPDDQARQKVIEWVKSVRDVEARKHAGDPGIVLARRLSNAEYNYTIRDLTGVDIQPTREFPVDPANIAGFDNSGESLSMSPALLDKYLQAAREVADHMVFKPQGLAFAPHLMLVETDRDKYAVNQIIDFYRRQNIDYSDYFEAAWRFKHRAVLGKPNTTLAAIAAESQVSAKYLATIWRMLEETNEEIGPGAKLQAMWRELPAPAGNQPDLARQGSDSMRDYVVQLRKKVELRHPDLQVKGIRRTAQPFLMWRNHQYATHRMSFDRTALQVEGEEQPVTEAATRRVGVENVDEGDEAADAPKRLASDPDLHVPAGQRERYEAAFERFSAVFPDHFYVSERGRYFPDNTRDKGRHLSAGFHNLMGYFRDDIPLYELILDEKGQQELDALWKELDFIANATARTHVQFYLFEADSVRRDAGDADSSVTPADKEITAEAKIKWLSDLYLARARESGNPMAIAAIESHFESINNAVRWVEQARAEAEPRHLEELLKLAARAYRRPLSQTEREDLTAFYRKLREDGLEHEPAMRDLVVNVLMSPDFCYRIDLVDAGARPTRGGPARSSGERNARAAQNSRDTANAVAPMPWAGPLLRRRRKPPLPPLRLPVRSRTTL